MASILLGVAVLLGTLVTLISPIIFIMLIEFFIIPGEERKLEKIFGEPFREYKKASGGGYNTVCFPGAA